MAELEELRQQRLNKLQRIRDRGIDPYPPRFHRAATTAEARARFEEAERACPAEPLSVRVAGRIVGNRSMGKIIFAHLQDGDGRLQILLRRETVGDERFAFYRRDFDVGDFIGVEGALLRTRTGEVTLEVHDFSLLAKALLPLPEKWHGLTDVEKRYRQRYLDLVVNPEVRRIFTVRSQVLATLRRLMDARGFLEVETPILQPLYGGAMARPFTTYYNALDRHFYLRIATELYLKRLIVGGLDKVYEIGKDFRNEGLSTQHNPEFTVMESYEAYADYQDVMAMVEELCYATAKEVHGTHRIPYQGHTIDLSPPWRRIPLREGIQQYAGIDIYDYPDQAALYEAAVQLGLRPEPEASWGKLVDDLLSHFVQPELIQPTFVVDYPVEISPLAKRKPENPSLVERFEAYVAGMEVGNAFTELNDPLDQRARFEEQVHLRERGDEEAQPLDEDYLTALEHGMPPTGGLGLGIDRLVMLMTDQSSIREVILFPHLRTRD
ncbi:MAG: lysine--tRNA ligase [Chloroflexi bacterium]|nr:lysine--tRNA ligase [Chloroflexota bacterium]